MTKDTTRDKILAAASDEFSANGYEKTTVRDICARADVNVAAVNYHFRDKQNLFYMVLSHWMDEFVKTSGIHEILASEDAPEEKVRAYIHAELAYICKENDPEGVQLHRTRLILQELSSEGHDPDIFRSQRDVEERLFYPIIEQLIDNGDPEVVRHACISASSIATHYFLMALADPNFILQTRKDLEFMTDFLTTFALGGLKAISEKYNA